MVDAPLQNATSVAVSRDLDTVSSHSIVNELFNSDVFNKDRRRQNQILPHLIILRSQLVQAFLNNMVAVQILDKHYNMKAERNDDRMDLSIVSKISLNPLPGKCGRLNKSETRLACLRVERKSIIF